MSDRTGGDVDRDKAGQAAIEGRAGATSTPPAEASPAGPHERPSLTDPDATPGTGSLPSRTAADEADPATG